MSDGWDDRKRAQEERYFEEQNRKALERLKSRKGEQSRISPVSGQPMEQRTYMGVVIDRCPVSGGIWLDAGELEQIIDAVKNDSQGSWIGGFLKNLTGKS